MEFSFGNLSRRIKVQINTLGIDESKIINSYGKDSFELGSVVQSIGRSLDRKFKLKTNKETGEITVTRVSLINPPINYTQFIQSQIEKMGVDVTKVLRTKGKDTFGCSPFVAAIGRKLGRKFKLKTDKATGKIWVGRVS